MSNEKQESKALVLKGVRLAFMDAWEAKPFKGGDQNRKRRTASFYIEPDSDNDKALRAEISRVAKAKWGEKAANIVTAIKDDKQKMCYLRKTKTNDEGEPYEGAEGMYALSTARPESKGPVAIVDRNPQIALTQQSGKPYSGSYVNAKVAIWAQDGEHRGIRAELVAIQFVRDGDAFGSGGPATASGFEDISEGADAADMDAEADLV